VRAEFDRRRVHHMHMGAVGATGGTRRHTAHTTETARHQARGGGGGRRKENGTGQGTTQARRKDERQRRMDKHARTIVREQMTFHACAPCALVRSAPHPWLTASCPYVSSVLRRRLCVMRTWWFASHFVRRTADVVVSSWPRHCAHSRSSEVTVVPSLTWPHAYTVPTLHGV
jgi:hypothetical protein